MKDLEQDFKTDRDNGPFRVKYNPDILPQSVEWFKQSITSESSFIQTDVENDLRQLISPDVIQRMSLKMSHEEVIRQLTEYARRSSTFLFTPTSLTSLILSV